MKILAYILTIFYYPAFFITLLIFHPIQWLMLKLGGYSAHKKSVDYMNLMLMGCLLLLGSRVVFRNRHRLPSDVSLIFVSNHQSMYDISPFGWFMRKHHPKFVSKIELSKGIPSISFNLRHGGSALIDRKDGKQAIGEIMKLARYIEKNNYSAVIYPEGTRSRNGHPKRFSENGLKVLTKFAPSAYVVPVTINNSWKFQQYGKFPCGIGIKMTLDTHEPIAVKTVTFEELFQKVEETVKGGVIIN
ncbi:MAG: lysophospholipid acyltransferase family protein [Bacteroidota bacterium]